MGWALKLYKVPRGNGWNGSNCNIGNVYVTAFSKSDARKAAKEASPSVLRWRVGPAEEVPNFVDGSVLRLLS